MIGEFLQRLVIALPLVCALAALLLLAIKRGWLRLPSALPLPRFLPIFLPRRAAATRPATAESLSIRRVHAIGPSARVAVLHFHGREHLLALNGQSLLLIASETPSQQGSAPCNG